MAVATIGSANSRKQEIRQRWVGVTSDYNTTDYNTVRASQDWIDINTNFNGATVGERDRFDFNPNPVHPYETIGADDAHAYGYTGSGMRVAIHDSGFCGFDGTTVLNKEFAGKDIKTYGTLSACAATGQPGHHGNSVAGWAVANFDNATSGANLTSIMGVAYDADLHLTEAAYTPADWALATDDAGAHSSVVINNSWGFDDDLNPDVIKAYMTANNATLAEALVAYQAITNEGVGDAANDTTNCLLYTSPSPRDRG